MNNQVLVSVVVPVYNVEKYLKRCIESIIEQTYEQLEIILVDDGSTDNCGGICDEYAQSDERITVFHQKNQGLSAARNTGINNAKGEYITFIDSDDFVHREYVEVLLHLCREYNCKVSQCDSECGEYDSFRWEERALKIKKWKSDEIISGKKREFRVIAWGKLYKKSLFDEVRFPVGRLHEDEYVTYKVVYESGNIVQTNQKLYYYFKRNNSIMNKPKKKINYDQLLAYDERISFFEKHREWNLVDVSRKELCIRQMCMYFAIYTKFKKEGEELYQDYRKNYKAINTYNLFSFKERGVMFLFYRAPKLLAVLENTFKVRERSKLVRVRK